MKSKAACKVWGKVQRAAGNLPVIHRFCQYITVYSIFLRWYSQSKYMVVKFSCNSNGNFN